MASNGTDAEPKKLSDLFEDAWKKFQEIDVCDLPSVSEKYQGKVKDCIALLIQCTNMVNMLFLFSSNETFDEVSTQNIKYLLLPVFLGELYQKLIANERSEIVETALVYFKDFLKRCNEYKIVKKDLICYCNIDEKNSKTAPTREEKIQRFKETKAIKEKINVLQKRLKEHDEVVDEETMHDVKNAEIRALYWKKERKRDYYTDWVKLHINNCIDNVKLIQDELVILAHMKNMKVVQKEEVQNKKLPPFKPILITRETLKSQVFGAGYRSLPTMSEEDYYQLELKQGKIVQEYNQNSSKGKEHGVDENSSDEDEETEENLKKAREWDDWKDTHRRGEGNKERHG